MGGETFAVPHARAVAAFCVGLRIVIKFLMTCHSTCTGMPRQPTILVAFRLSQPTSKEGTHLTSSSVDY